MFDNAKMYILNFTELLFSEWHMMLKLVNRNKVNKPWKIIIIMTFANLIYNLTNDQKRTFRKIEKKILKNKWSIIFNEIYI